MGNWLVLYIFFERNTPNIIYQYNSIFEDFSLYVSTGLEQILKIATI